MILRNKDGPSLFVGPKLTLVGTPNLVQTQKGPNSEVTELWRAIVQVEATIAGFSQFHELLSNTRC